MRGPVPQGFASATRVVRLNGRGRGSVGGSPRTSPSTRRTLMKVYVSSTYQDLVEHRAAVDRTLRRMGHDVIGMEQYVAEGSKPVDRCKADVRAADVYVIIVAWRFGHVPGRNASPADLRSITEIELDEAKASGRP